MSLVSYSKLVDRILTLPLTILQNPAWYDTLWHVIYTGMWQGDTSVSKQQQIFQGVHDAAERLRELVPNSGVYQNEVDVYQSNHIEDFWGRENYDRLVSIKQKVE